MDWYRSSFKAFDGALDSKQTIIQRIAELKDGGASHITINSYLRCINAYFHWQDGKGEKYSPQCSHLHIPRLKEEQKILVTLSADMIKALTLFRPVGVNLHRAHLVALTILDMGTPTTALFNTVGFD